MRRFAVAVAVLLLMESAAWANEEGLVSHYTFDEGSETPLRDMKRQGERRKDKWRDARER